METWTLLAHILALVAVLGLGAVVTVLLLLVFIRILWEMERND